LYIRKNKTEKYMPVIKEADPVELERHDLIFFEDPQKYIKIDIDEHSRGVLFRYAVVM